MALNVPLPKKVLGHPWLLFGENKMSKSRGNVLYGDKLAEQFGVDAVRYYLLSEMGFYNDGSITYESLIARTNSDLANIIGNLVSRTSAMIKQYFGGTVPAPTSAVGEADETLKNAVSAAKEAFMAKMDEYLVADASEAVLNGFKACNKYIDETTPWVLAKSEESRDRLATVMANLVQSIRICTAMLYPYIPSTAKRIAEVFAYGEDAYDYDKLGFDYKVDGVTVNADGAKLFERIDEKKFMAAIEAEQKEKEKERKKEEKKAEKAEKKAEKAKELIGIDDFAKVELTVGKILTCEKVEKSDKLLKLTVDIGETRQVVSGIAKWYAPEALIGKKIILVSNLRPAVLRGVESNGMILASGEDEVKVVFIDDSVPVGSKVR
jgi:methionyl-tRNA synthetase